VDYYISRGENAERKGEREREREIEAIDEK